MINNYLIQGVENELKTSGADFNIIVSSIQFYIMNMGLELREFSS